MGSANRYKNRRKPKNRRKNKKLYYNIPSRQLYYKNIRLLSDHLTKDEVLRQQTALDKIKIEDLEKQKKELMDKLTELDSGIENLKCINTKLESKIKELTNEHIISRTNIKSIKKNNTWDIILNKLIY